MTIYNNIWSMENIPEHYMSKFPEKLLDVFVKRSVKKVLDLGSGEGNIMIMLAKMGLDVTGIEISKEGVEKTKEKAQKENIKVEIINDDIYKILPFDDNAFDAVIGLQSLNHNSKDKIIVLFKEIKRVLKTNGIFGLKIADIDSYKLEHIKDNIYKDTGIDEELEFIDKQTYIPITGHEKGLMHYAFYMDELNEELKKIGFKKIILEKRKWHILAVYEN